MIVMMAGLPGTGKSTLARELASRTGGRVVGKDEIRSALFSAKEIEYSQRQDDFCLQIMLQVASYVLRQNSQRKVFLDGRPFSRRYQIENVLTTAASLHQSWRILECICPARTAEQRLIEQASQHSAGNRDYKLYLEVKARFEAITFPKTVIDTGGPLAICVERALSALQ